MGRELGRFETTNMHSLGLILLLFAADADSAPERRALAYLAREVPRWAADNKCYSCHNNGDAARALFLASRHSLKVPERATADTLRWLTRPGEWDKNAEDAPERDKGLARLQFASALVDAIDAGLVKDAKPLKEAAELVAKEQTKDGGWKGGDGVVGSPVTYGSCLATHFARRTLQRADAEKYKEALARSDRWLRNARPENVLDAAAVLLALQAAVDEAATAQRRRCLAIIQKGEKKEVGGWGPFVTAAAEPFDTAIVLLALRGLKEKDDVRPLLRRGRAFLIARQSDDGSWPETTRPAGNESYAQRLSTTGWALQALLATRE
jgi:hypothetical protein